LGPLPSQTGITKTFSDVSLGRDLVWRRKNVSRGIAPPGLEAARLKIAKDAVNTTVALATAKHSMAFCEGRPPSHGEKKEGPSSWRLVTESLYAIGV